MKPEKSPSAIKKYCVFPAGIRKKRAQSISAIILIIFAFLSAISCNPEEWEIIDCSECYTEKPEKAEINVKLTINELNPEVVINIFSGRLEEDILILSDTSQTETWSTILPADRYYSVTATYRSHYYENITAIDGNFVRTKKIRAICDMPCWVIRGNNFNVKLKY